MEGALLLTGLLTAGCAINAASLGVAASCQPAPVTFSSRTGSCPLNVAELL